MVLATDATQNYPDLRARVFIDTVPATLAAELPSLYHSVFATEPWFRLCDEQREMGACLLEQPRHVLVFTVDGRTVEVLNKVFPVPPHDVARACCAILRAVPSAQRIHVEVRFPPARLSIPHRVLRWGDDLVIDLPRSTDAYRQSLGRSTRKHLRNYENRIRKAHPDLTHETVPAHGRGSELFDEFLTLHLPRQRRTGVQSLYEKEPEQVRKLAALLDELGEAEVTRVQGDVAAIELVFHVGSEATIYAGAFADKYEEDHLGLLSVYWAICAAIDRGARRCHLLWGTGYYKKLLGARPVRAYRLSIFRSDAARLSSPREALTAQIWRLQHEAPTRYWQARHAARRALEKVRDGLPGAHRHEVEHR